MPSIVTSIIGGIQGASASHNAANALQQGYGQAGSTVTNAANTQDPLILAAAQNAAQGVSGAGQGVANTANAGANSITGTAAQSLAGLNPYTSAGATAANQLSAATAPGGTYSTPFNASMMEQNDPGYQFRIAQGDQAAQRLAAAGGNLGSGGTLKALTQYGQNAASSEYNNAFNQYQTQQNNSFNRLATLAGMGQQAGEFGAGLQTGAATNAAGLQLAGANSNLGAREWAGGANIGAQNLSSSNALSAANFLANSQIGSAKGLAAGDIGAANSWNQMLGGIGSAGNAILTGGMSGLLPGQNGVGWGGGATALGPNSSNGFFG